MKRKLKLALFFQIVEDGQSKVTHPVPTALLCAVMSEAVAANVGAVL
ncbi:hypothetical protein [Paraburkholderia franconis]|nr:hypothetical protein [Paraburkholderia franconis]